MYRPYSQRKLIQSKMSIGNDGRKEGRGKSGDMWISHSWSVSDSFESHFDCKEIKPALLKEINPDYAKAEIPILWSSDAKSRLIGKDPDAGKGWRQKMKGRQRMRSLDNITNSMDMNLSKIWDTVDRGALCAAGHGITKNRTQLSDWKTTTIFKCLE